MQSVNRFYATGFTLQALVAAAYSLTPRAISGGAAWTDSDRYDILASTPGDVQPNLDEQMAMLRRLLIDRFQLDFHREPKELPVYAITVAKGGSKLKPSATPPGTLAGADQHHLSGGKGRRPRYTACAERDRSCSSRR